jgi:integral membrane protein (TIGR00529 family)
MVYQIALLVIAIALTVFLLRKKVNIGIIMLINCVFIILAVGMSFDRMFQNTVKGITQLKTLNLLIIFTEILIVENIMRKNKMIEKMVLSLRGLIGNSRISIMVLPALIGLMPSPGGARFSCPMVDELVTDEMKNEDKAFVNYWYRHIWRDGFILYPAVIIAAELLEVTVMSLFLHILVFTIIHMLIGYILIRKGIKVKEESYSEDKKVMRSTFINNFLPVGIIILSYMLLLMFFGDSLRNNGISTIVLLNIAVVPVIVFLFIKVKYSFKKVLKTFKEAFQVKFLIIIMGVMVFKEFLVDSGLIDIWISYITENNIPKEILYILLPFLAGFTSGLAINYATLAMPILMPLGLGNSLWLASASMMAGFSGVMLTPLHLCNIMSCDYFKTDFHKVLKKVGIAEFVMLIFIIFIILIFR